MLIPTLKFVASTYNTFVPNVGLSTKNCDELTTVFVDHKFNLSPVIPCSVDVTTYNFPPMVMFPVVFWSPSTLRDMNGDGEDVLIPTESVEEST